MQIGRDEGAEVLIGGARPQLGDALDDGCFYEPTVLQGDNSMRVFQEEIFGPVLAVTTFSDEAEALRIANDTMYGLGAGVWTRDGNRAFRVGRAIKAGRVWTNCYHLYPAGAAFGGYKASGVGRENHRMMLDHYTQTKCLLVSYDSAPMGSVLMARAIGGPAVRLARAAGRRRWFIGLEPIFEGGRHGRRARAWDVEQQLTAIALLGDVTIDLSNTRSAPAEIAIDAYAIFRDVDVLVAEGTHVELSGRGLRGELRNDVPAVQPGRRAHVIRIHGHTVLGDVTVSVAPR